MHHAAAVTRLLLAACCALVLTACERQGEHAEPATGAVPAPAAAPIADAPPPAGKCIGWQRSLTAGEGEHAWEVERCLRALALRDRAAAVAEAQALLAWDIAPAAQPRLLPLAVALSRFPQPGALLRHLDERGLVDSQRQPDPEDLPALTAEDHLIQRGRTLWFDVETGFFPNEHDLLLAELAALAGPPLTDVAFVEVAPSLEDDARRMPYLLKATLDGRTLERTAENYGDWYDMEAVLQLLNTLAAQGGMPLRYYMLPTGDQTAIVWAADPAAVAALEQARLLVVDDPVQPMETGKAFEQQAIDARRPPG